MRIEYLCRTFSSGELTNGVASEKLTQLNAEQGWVVYAVTPHGSFVTYHMERILEDWDLPAAGAGDMAPGFRA